MIHLYDKKMTEKELFILSHCQHLMNPSEKLVARWLTEEWDGSSTKLPRWLLSKIWCDYPSHVVESPKLIIHWVCERVLPDSKHDFTIPK
jgi:hypothetical protein